MKFKICVTLFAALFCFSIAQEFTEDDAKMSPEGNVFKLLVNQVPNAVGAG